MQDGNEFGKQEKARRRPLKLDEVLSGCPRVGASSSRLSDLPADVLADIVDFLLEDAPTLYNLALVNSTCRQLPAAVPNVVAHLFARQIFVPHVSL